MSLEVTTTEHEGIPIHYIDRGPGNRLRYHAQVDVPGTPFTWFINGSEFDEVRTKAEACAREAPEQARELCA